MIKRFDAELPHKKPNLGRPFDSVTWSRVVWQCHCSCRASGVSMVKLSGSKTTAHACPGHGLRCSRSTPNRAPRAPEHPASGFRCSTSVLRQLQDFLASIPCTESANSYLFYALYRLGGVAAFRSWRQSSNQPF